MGRAVPDGGRRADGRVRAAALPEPAGKAMLCLLLLGWPGDPHAVTWLSVWEGPFARNPFAGG